MSRALNRGARPRDRPDRGRHRISRFVESLVRPHVLSGDLGSGYQEMAADEAREAEVHEWAEGTVGDVAHEAR